jgi:hypothetical protein
MPPTSLRRAMSPRAAGGAYDPGSAASPYGLDPMGQMLAGGGGGGTMSMVHMGGGGSGGGGGLGEGVRNKWKADEDALLIRLGPARRWSPRVPMGCHTYKRACTHIPTHQRMERWKEGRNNGLGGATRRAGLIRSQSRPFPDGAVSAECVRVGACA